jgi:hypothetical protein
MGGGDHSTWYYLTGIAACAISIVAGVYLLQTQAADENSLIEVIMHGMGGYFIARGVWMIHRLTD